MWKRHIGLIECVTQGGAEENQGVLSDTSSLLGPRVHDGPVEAGK